MITSSILILLFAEVTFAQQSIAIPMPDGHIMHADQYGPRVPKPTYGLGPFGSSLSLTHFVGGLMAIQAPTTITHKITMLRMAMNMLLWYPNRHEAAFTNCTPRGLLVDGGRCHRKVEFRH